MALSEELISQFAKITKDEEKTPTEKTVYGTVVEREGVKYVQFDGSDILTPVAATTNYEPDERVIVTIKNHTATITGNFTSPSARTTEVEAVDRRIKNFMYHDAVNGLQIGDRSTGTWVGFRTQIVNNAFNILNVLGDAVASYGEKLIELGKNATDAIIKLCGGKGQIEYVTDDDTSDEYLQIHADKVRLKGKSMSSVYSMYTDDTTRWEKSAVNVSPTKVHMYASECIDPSLHDMLEGWNITEVSVNSGNVDITTPGNITMNAASVVDGHGQFESVYQGSSGIWSYKQWSNGIVELWGTYEISNMDCKTSLGAMYRSDVFTIDPFPFTVYNPNVTASYESDGYGAMLWATSTATTAQVPSYYLIRPISTTIVEGKINFHVWGNWST